MFTSLVVALDLEASGDRALPVVRAWPAWPTSLSSS